MSDKCMASQNIVILKIKDSEQDLVRLHLGLKFPVICLLTGEITFSAQLKHLA